MNRLHYFNKIFFPISAGLFVGTTVYGLFDLDFSHLENMTKLLGKAFVTAIVTGIFLGLLNMFLKKDPFPKKQ